MRRSFVTRGLAHVSRREKLRRGPRSREGPVTHHNTPPPSWEEAERTGRGFGGAEGHRAVCGGFYRPAFSASFRETRRRRMKIRFQVRPYQSPQQHPLVPNDTHTHTRPTRAPVPPVGRDLKGLLPPAFSRLHVPPVPEGDLVGMANAQLRRRRTRRATDKKRYCQPNKRVPENRRPLPFPVDCQCLPPFSERIVVRCRVDGRLFGQHRIPASSGMGEWRA